MKAARPAKRARLTVERTLALKLPDILFITLTLSHTHVFCHDYCQFH